MDISTIDQQYAELRNQAQTTAGEVTTLADKLRAAAQSGNQDAREWMLDLKEITLAIQAEQNQVGTLLQALHAFVVTQGGQPTAAAQNQFPAPTSPPPPMPWGQPQAPGYAPQQPSPPPQQQSGGMGGMLGSFMNSGFGQAMTMGAGFGVGDGLINSLFSGFGGRRGC